jgi:outer membrane protein
MIRTLITTTMAFMSILVIGQGSIQDTAYFSLQEAMDYSIENNLNAENARLDVDIADQRVWESVAAGLPQISGSMDYNYNINLATTLIPDFLGNPSDKIEVQFGTKHFATAGLVGNQLIFSGQYIVGLQAAKIFKEFSRKNQERTEQQVKQTVMQNYYLVLLSESTLEAIKGNLENMQQTYNETRQLYMTGFVEEIDADQLEVALTNLENGVLSMERQVVATRNLLKYQMGLERSKAIVLTDSLSSLVGQVDFETALNQNLDLEENIDYQILDKQERLAFMNMKLKRAEYLPALSAFYSMDFTAQRDEFSFFRQNDNWYRASFVGLSFSLPIFSSGLRRAGVSQKKIAYNQAINNKAFAAEGLAVEFLQARYDFASALEKYRSDQRNLDLTRKVIQVTKIKYNEGLVSSLEYTQVNDQYLRTLSSFTSSMVELLNSKIKIDLLLNNI